MMKYKLRIFPHGVAELCGFTSVAFTESLSLSCSGWIWKARQWLHQDAFIFFILPCVITISVLMRIHFCKILFLGKEESMEIWRIAPCFRALGVGWVCHWIAWERFTHCHVFNHMKQRRQHSLTDTTLEPTDWCVVSLQIPRDPTVSLWPW